MTYDVIDLFSGPDGWGTGFRQTGSPLSVLGIEIEPNARETAMANGHKTILQDIATLEPQHYGHTGELKGLIASPPCPGFSSAGKGLGRKDLDMLVLGIGQMRMGADPDKVIADVARYAFDERSKLTLEPLRWALSLRPEWTVWEQVPAVLPIWEACAEALRGIGYNVWVGKLHAEQHGVPQTRTRAVLIASRTREVQAPDATHSKYYSRDPKRLDRGVEKWVSMEEALGWTDGIVGFPRKSDGQEEILIDGQAYRARDMRETNKPSQVVTEKARSWQYVNGNQANSARRDADLPAPTVHFGARSNKVEIQFCGAGITSEQSAGQKPREMEQPAHTITGKGTAAFKAGPVDDPCAPTESRKNRLGKPTNDDPTQLYPAGVTGIAAGRGTTTPSGVITGKGTAAWGDKDRVQSRRVTVQEAAILQSFPADYVWCGSKTSAYQQCGNAIPPLLAQRILEVVL